MTLILLLCLAGALLVTLVLTLVTKGGPLFYLGVFALFFSIYFIPSVAFYYLIGALA